MEELARKRILSLMVTATAFQDQWIFSSK